MARTDGLTGWFSPRGSHQTARVAMIPRDVYNILATFRFCAVAAMVVLTGILGSREALETSTVAVVTLAAAYSVLIVALGERLVRWPRATHLILGLDSALAVAGILLGGGIDSPFLLYALLPILTAAILLNRAFTLALALVVGASVILAHTAGYLYLGEFPWIMDGNYLTLVPVYVAVCLGIALLPFYANLNLRRLEQVAARREEQHRLRAELHDKLAQSLSALTLGLRQLRRVTGSTEQLAEMAEVSERSYRELRELLDLLEAGTWEPTAAGSLAHLVEAWEEETGIRVIATFPDGDLELPPEVTIALLGIARESLTNTAKHSGATLVWVDLKSDGEGTLLSVRDNGHGFSPDQPSGHGRRIMRERAEGIGAILEISSSPDRGTEVQVRYPRRR